MARSARTTGTPVTAAARSMAAKRSPGRSTTNRAASPRSRTSSTVTIESIPPPKGTSGRSSALPLAGAGGASVVGASIRRPDRSSPLR
jgi:hypothetical protein